MIWMLHLYPRRWRRRYGEEVAALVAGERPSFRLFFDLLAGAVDARLDPRLTPATGGPRQVTTIERLCAHSRRDERHSGPLMIGSSLAFVAIALVLHLAFDQVLVSQVLLFSAFPLSRLPLAPRALAWAPPRPSRSYWHVGARYGSGLEPAPTGGAAL